LELFFKKKNIVHVTGDVNYLGLLLKRRKTIHTILDCVHLNNTSGIRHKILKLFWVTIPVKRSRFITAISTSTKNEILKYVKCDPGKIVVIPVAISTAFQYVPKQFNKSKPVILQLGTAPNKNIERLIEALKGIPCRMEIIGAYHNHLVELMEANGIEFNYSQGLTNEEIIQKYIAADIISLASTYEGFGMPIIEGQATGRAVLTSNLYSMPEVGGKAAHYVDPYSVDSIRKGFQKIIGDDGYREGLIQEGLENVKRFDPQEIANQYLGLYERIGGRKIGNELEIVYFQRKPIKDFHFSVEIIFDDLKRNLPPWIKQTTKISKFYSKGFFPRLYNCVEAYRNQKQINHVTGDISYVGVFLNPRKTIHTILDCVFLQNKNKLETGLLKYYWLKMPVKRSVFVTTISESVKKEILDLVPCNPEKIVVIPIPKSEVFKRYDKSFNRVKPRILIIGSAPNKNFNNIIRSLTGIDCIINIVGKYEKEYVKLFESLKIEYIYESGLNVMEMNSRYQKADLLVFASTYEGFGMPIIEAQAVGVPVVTSNISSMPEVAGDAAVLVNPFDSNEIRKGVLSVINNSKLRNDIIQKGFVNAERFNSDKITMQFLNLYKQIAK
jgi:glycosyltransferase involved in cell wall biosynthesis